MEVRWREATAQELGWRRWGVVAGVFGLLCAFGFALAPQIFSGSASNVRLVAAAMLATLAGALAAWFMVLVFKRSRQHVGHRVSDPRRPLLHAEWLKRHELSPALQLTGVDLREADLAGARLAAANLTGARLDRAVLVGANLTGAQLAGARLDEAQLHGAKLARAWLSGANLARAILEGADLTGAHLEGADLRGTCLVGVRGLKRAHLDKRTLSDVWTVWPDGYRLGE